MIPVLDAEQAAAWDERARTVGRIPGRVLMESAGRGIARVIAKEFGPELTRGVIVAAGPGNNGGDGWVIARSLHALGVRVLATEAGGKRTEDCATNRALALSTGVERLEADGPWPAVGLVVDAMLGTGARGAPRAGISALADRVAGFGAPVAAVDGPTGLDLSTGEAHGPIRAQLTVTFGGPRRGHLVARDWCGKVAVIDIGFPPADSAWPGLATDDWARAVLPGFHPTMHKGERGKLLVVGGDDGMAGAAIHAARAALYAGAGMVKLAAAEPTIRAAQEILPDALTVMTRLGPDLEPDLQAGIEWSDAIVIGPGLGRGKDRASFVKGVLERSPKPALVDADALHAGIESWGARQAPRVVTPHAAEFAVAFGAQPADRFRATVEAARSSGATVLLKGVPTIIATPEGAVTVSASGNPALATGGSGDVLSGIIGALLARKMECGPAATLGAYALGRAAELAAENLSARATRPADVMAALPALWKAWAEPSPSVDPPILVELPAIRLA